MPRGERRGGRYRHERLDPRIRDRRASPIEHVLQNARQGGGDSYCEQARERRGGYRPSTTRVAARPDGDQERPLDPPGGGQDEENRERLPADGLAGLDRKAVQLDKLVEDGVQGASS
jgi:hypothetical protein